MFTPGMQQHKLRSDGNTTTQHLLALLAQTLAMENPDPHLAVERKPLDHGGGNANSGNQGSASEKCDCSLEQNIPECHRSRRAPKRRNRAGLREGGQER